MSYLKDLVGQPLHEVSDEELEEIIMKGRIAREEESSSYSAKKKAGKTKTPATPKIPEVSIDLDFDSMPD